MLATRSLRPGTGVRRVRRFHSACAARYRVSIARNRRRDACGGHSGRISMRVATMHASLGLLLVLTPQTAADWSAGKDEDPDSLQSMWSAWMRPDQVENANILAGVHTKSTTTSRHHPPPPAQYR